MQWSDVTRAQSPKVLRQFGLICLAVFGGMAVWRLAHGQGGAVTMVLGLAGLVLGSLGLAAPATLGPVFTTWMVVAFPIGWTVSRVLLGVLYFLLFTPVALVFRLMGRDALRLRRGAGGTYWIPKSGGSDPASYLRQS